MRCRRNISNWKKVRTLGCGAYGLVHEGITEDEFSFAIKEASLLDQRSLGKQWIDQLMKEIALMSQFEHENIIQYYGTEKDESNIYVFFELAAQGTIRNLYKTRPLQYYEVSQYTRQILYGLKYLHDQDVIHRDINCANILVHDDGSIKLAGFEAAEIVSNDTNSFNGTPYWMAPEIVKANTQGYGLPADIWSLGCTVLEMLTGKVPYGHLEPVQALFQIWKSNPPDIPNSLPAVAKNFIKQCLQFDPNNRPTATQLLHHPFVRPRPRRNISNWERVQHLGSGSFGSVYEGITEDGFSFAIKEVSLLDWGSDWGMPRVDQLRQEIALLSQFEHENIVQYYDTDEDESNLYVFLELATKGSLRKLYQKHRLQVSQVSAYTRQILHGLKYLHDQNVIHRDIKCANILVNDNGSIKLADFGIAKFIIDDINSFKGTIRWMAPEVLKGKYGLSADIWSLGCTVLEMLTGEVPYAGLKFPQVLGQLTLQRKPNIPESLPEDTKHFIEKCLQFNPNDRPTAAQLLHDSFVL